MLRQSFLLFFPALAQTGHPLASKCQKLKIQRRQKNAMILLSPPATSHNSLVWLVPMTTVPLARLPRARCARDAHARTVRGKCVARAVNPLVPDWDESRARSEQRNAFELLERTDNQKTKEELFRSFSSWFLKCSQSAFEVKRHAMMVTNNATLLRSSLLARD